MNAGEFFGKYVGVQGIVAGAMVAGYIAAPYTGAELPAGYTELMSLVLGYYFAKNGAPGLTDLARSLRGGGSSYDPGVG